MNYTGVHIVFEAHLSAILFKNCLHFLINTVINRGQPSAVFHSGVSIVSQEKLYHLLVVHDDSIVKWSESRIADKMVNVRIEFIIPHCSNCSRKNIITTMNVYQWTTLIRI